MLEMNESMGNCQRAVMWLLVLLLYTAAGGLSEPLHAHRVLAHSAHKSQEHRAADPNGSLSGNN